MRMATGDRHTLEQVVHKLAQADRAVQECLVTALLWVDAPPDDPVEGRAGPLCDGRRVGFDRRGDRCHPRRAAGLARRPSRRRSIHSARGQRYHWSRFSRQGQSLRRRTRHRFAPEGC